MQIKAGDEARAAYALVFWLLEMVKSLQERVDRLEAERTRHTPGPALHDELTASRDRLATARTQLAQARRERERAEEIRLATRRLVEERLHERAAADRPVDAESYRTLQPDDEPFAAAEDFGLAPLYEVDHVLEASEERIREQAGQLDKLSEDLRLPGSATESTADAPTVVPGHLADPTPSAEADATAAAPSKRHRGRALLAGVAVLALLTPTSAYESRTSGLEYDMSSVPVKVVPGETGNASTPSYSYNDFAQLRGMTNTNDIWSTYVPRIAPPVITFERRLRARLVLTPVRPISAECADYPGSVAWTLTVNDVSGFASGTLSLAELAGDSTEIDREIPEDGTITLTASGGGICAFTLRLHRPSVHYRGLWAST